MRLSELSQPVKVAVYLMGTKVPEVEIMRTTQKADSLSGIEYLSLAVQAASNLQSQNVMIPVDVAKQLLAEAEAMRLGELAVSSFGHRDPEYTCQPNPPPPLEITSVSPEEQQRRTRSLSYAADRPGYAGIWKKASRSEVPTNERRALKDAGRGRLIG